MRCNAAFRIDVKDFGYAETDKLAFINDLLLGVIARKDLLQSLRQCKAERLNKPNAENRTLHGIFVGSVDDGGDVFIVPISETANGPQVVVNTLYSKISERRADFCKAVLQTSNNGSTLSLQTRELKHRSRRRGRRQTASIKPGTVKRLTERFSSQTSLAFSECEKNKECVGDESRLQHDCFGSKVNTRKRCPSNLSCRHCSLAPAAGAAVTSSDSDDSRHENRPQRVSNFSSSSSQTGQPEDPLLGRTRNTPRTISSKMQVTIGRSPTLHRPLGKQATGRNSFIPQHCVSNSIEIGRWRQRRPSYENRNVFESQKACCIGTSSSSSSSDLDLEEPRCVDRIRYPFSNYSSTSEENLQQNHRRLPMSNNSAAPKNVGPEELDFEDLKRENEIWQSLRSVEPRPVEFKQQQQPSSPPNQREIDYNERVRRYSLQPTPVNEAPRKPLITSFKSLRPLIKAAHRLRIPSDERATTSKGEGAERSKAPKPSNGRGIADSYDGIKLLSHHYPVEKAIKSALSCPRKMKSREWNISDLS